MGFLFQCCHALQPQYLSECRHREEDSYCTRGLPLSWGNDVVGGLPDLNVHSLGNDDLVSSIGGMGVAVGAVVGTDDGHVSFGRGVWYGLAGDIQTRHNFCYSFFDAVLVIGDANYVSLE